MFKINTIQARCSAYISNLPNAQVAFLAYFLLSLPDCEIKSHNHLFSTLQSQLETDESILSFYTILCKGRAKVAAKPLGSHTPVMQEEPIAAIFFLAPPHACRHLKPIPPPSSTTHNPTFCSTACQTTTDN